jgi:hypothetical protein
VCVLGTDDVDCREESRDGDEQAGVGDEAAGADAPAEAKACRARIADGRVKLAIWGEVPLRMEPLGLWIVGGIVENAPTR